MNVLRAFQLILVAGLKNRVLSQVRRLKQPRYLIATVIGVAYWWLYLGRNLLGIRRAGRVPVEWSGAVDAIATAVGLLLVAGVWIFGADRAALTFSEAEIQFLFPAPTTRKALVHYKLLRSLLVGLFSALISTLLFGRAIAGNPLFFIVGFWLGLSTLSLHGLGASLTRQGLAEHGARGLLRRLPTLVVLGTILAAVAWAFWTVGPPAPFKPSREWVDDTLSIVRVAPLSWVLLPIQAFTHLMFAADGAAFLRSLPVALGVLGLHYVWVITSDTSFEETSLEAAEARAKRMEARRGGARPPVTRKKRDPPFRLAPTGRPEVALVWKSLIAAGRIFSLRFLIGILIAMVIAAAIPFFSGEGVKAAAAFAGFFALAFWGMVTIGGGTMIRADLRRDLEYVEILRSLPIAGRQIVLAEALGTLLPVAVMQWLLLALAVALAGGEPLPVISLPDRLAVGLALALLGPAFSLAGILVQNAVVIIVPGWVGSGRERPRGPEAIGMRLILVMGNLLVVLLGLLPAALLGGLTALVFWPLLGLLGVPIAAAVAAAAILAEVWVAAALLGHAFEKFEPSA